ncbi:hypothetical protein KEM54_000533 [Ascosphaera aggregata]|nr:hypothetical protein KEM54_000533 [Ascosphaera aggregata]
MAANASESDPLLPRFEATGPSNRGVAAAPTSTTITTTAAAASPAAAPTAPSQHAKSTAFSSNATSASQSLKTNARIPNPGGAGGASGGNSPSKPVLAAFNTRLRRRHSSGSNALGEGSSSLGATPKVGPQRTTKKTQKLKLLPNPERDDEGEEELIEDGVPQDVYSQIRRIKEPTARRDAARLGKSDRDRLPRVTAYCTASAYALEAVVRFLKSRAPTRGAAPRLFDECVYSPYKYDYDRSKNRSAKQHRSSTNGNPEGAVMERRHSDSEIEVEDHRKQHREDLINLEDEQPENPPITHDVNRDVSRHMEAPDGPVLDTTVDTPEVFLFDYGTVVIWGMTPTEETRFLTEVSRFAESVLSDGDMQVENFNFYYTRDYQARIYNDFISLRDPKNYMIKLAISHALAQSVKTSLFEDLVDESIETTAPLPAQIAEKGSVNLTRRQINMQIGELFILRINIHLQGSVLDAPELMWAEPHLDPVYQAVRSYLEMDQRVGLLTERLEVISDLLAVLKDQLTHRHDEYLEWIVIVLIAAEIVVAAINIVVDLYAGE